MQQLVARDLQLDTGYRKTVSRKNKLRSILKTSSRRGEQLLSAQIEDLCHAIVEALVDNLPIPAAPPKAEFAPE